MEQIMQSQIFFFISSVGFIVFFVLGTIFLIYLIRTMKAFSRIMDKVEANVDMIGEKTADLLEDVQESSIFRLFFKRKKKRAERTTSK
jgi:uncharacterized protein YoxC